METITEKEAFLGNYLGLLSGLSMESKIKIIEALNIDIKNNGALKTDWIDKLYGSFISDKSAESIVSELRHNRLFSREVTGF
jgi:hypothetical protein